jgi:lipoprotein-anchoring transpeptidase ErfK/SrfK
MALAAFAAQPPQPGAMALRQVVAWQVALERAGFSPGIIDGKLGARTLLALRELQRARGQPAAGRPDPAEILGACPEDAICAYTVRQSDMDQVTGACRGWLEKSKAKRLGYRSLGDELAEEFHCSAAVLSALNDHADLARLKVGDRVAVPTVAPSENRRAAQLEINLAEKAIRCFDEDGRTVALFHCSIAREADHRPLGRLKVVSVTRNPQYLFDPAMWPEARSIHHKLVIPPGPRNPVGLYWIALDRPGYGIHGAANPELIGKTGSHGCFRLTNWDAVRLSRMVRPGTRVDVVDGQAHAPGSEQAALGRAM